MRRLVVAGVMAGLVVACGDELAEEAGEMLVDAGEMLRDAGNDDASAQSDGGPLVVTSETYEARCDVKDLEVVTTQDSRMVEPPRTTRTTSLSAVINVPTTDITGVDVVVCRAQPFDPCTQPNASCEGSTMPRPPLARCITTTAEIGDGFVRASCYGLRGIGETARFTIRR